MPPRNFHAKRRRREGREASSNASAPSAAPRLRVGVRGEDSGQLMMLAGIVLTISFIMTALTLSQVSQLEREAAAQISSPIIGEWRFLHERLGANLRTAVGPDTTRAAFEDSVLPTVQATFRSVMSEKGYDLTIRLAGDPMFAPWGNEAQLLNPAGTHYDEWTWDGRTHFVHPVAEDPVGTTDGILWQDASCPDASAPAAGCIGGAYLYVRLTDGVSTIEESMLFDTNRP